ncbi:MAG: futalosine hydrolase [Ilyomonas sp.]
MHVIVTAATAKEYEPCLKTFEPTSHLHKISFFTTGVGMLATAVSLTSLFLNEKPDLIIQAGIAGTFDHSSSLGGVFVIRNEIIADMGVEENNVWKDIFDLHLQNSNESPFKNKSLPNSHLPKLNLLHLEEADAITINEITTDKKRIEQYIDKYHPVIESMEGAALHYAAAKFDIPFIQLRALSNYIGERDKTKWKLQEAISKLNDVLLNYLEQLKRIKSL